VDVGDERWYVDGLKCVDLNQGITATVPSHHLSLFGGRHFVLFSRRLTNSIFKEQLSTMGYALNAGIAAVLANPEPAGAL
jgi:hypothetical protein